MALAFVLTPPITSNGSVSIELGAILDDFLHASDNSTVRVLERFPLALR